MLRTLKHGDTGREVSALRGILSLKDGTLFDDAVLDKIKAGQKKHNLTVDGIVGPATWTALAKSTPTIKKGASGPIVRGLQYLLDGLTPDGKFGSKTISAVKTYKAAVGLKKNGIAGPKVWLSLLTGSTTDESIPTTPPTTGKFHQPKDFKQASKPWGPKMYSSTGNKKQTYANSGCGPTAMADIIYTVKDKTATPETLGKLALKWGCRTSNSGTAWSFFKKVADHYKFKKFAQTSSMATMKAALDQGAYVVASMGPGYWTKGGHFINPWKHADGYIYANDPASSSRKKQKEAQFGKERKQFFIFWA